MILYFSATGNTEFIAKELAKKLDDECVNLLYRVKTNDHTPLHSEKPFIICAPVYVCEIPRFMTKYLKEQTFTGNKEVYFIFTSGGYCGISGVLAKSLFKKKNMIYRGHAEFKMPRNYVINDSYPMLEKEEVEKAEQDVLIDIPIVVLVNENSASSSEILAGALKDLDEATIVGITTYGKGVIQELLSFKDGSGLKVTTHEYYTPNRNKINGIGIVPDVVVELPETVLSPLYVERNEDTQLQKAIEILK